MMSLLERLGLIPLFRMQIGASFVEKKNVRDFSIGHNQAIFPIH
jgi:hypothetical protein